MIGICEPKRRALERCHSFCFFQNFSASRHLYSTIFWALPKVPAATFPLAYAPDTAETGAARGFTTRIGQHRNNGLDIAKLCL